MNFAQALLELAKEDFYKRQSEAQPSLGEWALGTERDRLARESHKRGAMIEQPYFKQGQLGATTTAEALWSGDTNPDAVNAMYIHSKLPDEQWSQVADLPEDAPVIMIEGGLPDALKRDTKAHEQRHATLQNPLLQEIIKQASPEAETGQGADEPSAMIEEGLVRFNDYYAGKDPYTRKKAEEWVDPKDSLWFALQRSILNELGNK